MPRRPNVSPWVRTFFRQACFPVVFILVLELMALEAVLVLQIFRQTNINFTDKFGLGYDFGRFYLSAQVLLSGISPYTIGHYVTPPLPTILNVPLVLLLDVRHASYVIFLLIPGCVLASLWLVQKSVNGAMAAPAKIGVILISAAVILFGYPFIFLLDRENIDGFVLLAVCAGIFLLPRKPRLAGILFAFAVSLKVYPLLLFLPLLIRRKKLTILWMCIGLLLLFLAAPSLWMEFLTSRIFTRSVEFRPDENISLTAMFFLIGEGLQRVFPHVDISAAAGWAAIGTYLALLAETAALDARMPRNISSEDEIVGIVMYFPFLIAVPQLVYHYEGILLIALLPVLCYAWARAREPGFRVFLLLAALGLAMLQIQVVALDRLLGTGRVDLIPGAGLFLTLIGCIGYKYSMFKSPAIINMSEKEPSPRAATG